MKKRGFTINEILISLAILTVAMAVAGELFGSAVNLWRQTAAFSNQATKTDSVLQRLRQDVWGCDQIVVPDARTARLHNSRGNWIVWTLGSDGTADRKDEASSNWQCQSVCAGWNLRRDGDCLVVTDSARDSAGTVYLISQVLAVRSGS
jgi:prepilin-type N-terminal cleavage/methylation domain-containing protein